MYGETLAALAERAAQKRDAAAASRGGYLVSAMLAGIYVGFGIILVNTVIAPFIQAGSPAAKLLAGACFGVALTLIIFAGSELFTGNNLIMSVGYLYRRVSARDVLGIWSWCYLGNFLGAVLFALLYIQTGLGPGPTAEFIQAAAAAKMTAPSGQLFFRGVLCNNLVCLAIWMLERAKGDAAKLILIWWVLFAFIGSGFEHSVANMVLFLLALLLPHPAGALTYQGMAANLIPVTLGNLVGGIVFVAFAYTYIESSTGRRTAPPDNLNIN